MNRRANTETGELPLEVACTRDDVKTMKLLLPFVDIHVANNVGVRPFDAAIQANSQAAVVLFLQKFRPDVLADPSHSSPCGPPVWNAVVHAGAEVLTALLEAGKSVAASEPCVVDSFCRF